MKNKWSNHDKWYEYKYIICFEEQYKSINVTIFTEDACVLKEYSQSQKWKMQHL